VVPVRQPVLVHALAWGDLANENGLTQPPVDLAVEPLAGQRLK
jgi:hypothetical protein